MTKKVIRIFGREENVIHKFWSAKIFSVPPNCLINFPSSNCLIVRLFSDAVCHRIYNKRRYIYTVDSATIYRHATSAFSAHAWTTSCVSTETGRASSSTCEGLLVDIVPCLRMRCRLPSLYPIDVTWSRDSEQLWHSFILAISISPLQVLYYSEALPTTACADTVSEFHAEAHRQLQVKNLPKVPTWRLKRESNPRPSG